MNEDDSDPEGLFHPAFVVRSLEFAEGLESGPLLAAAKLTDRTVAGYIPEQALVRLVRRFRVNGQKELSDRLARPLVERAYAYALRICSKFADEGMDLASEAIKDFLTVLAQVDTIDWWEIQFRKELHRCISDAYVRLYGRHRKRSRTLPETYDHHDDGEEARQLMLRAGLAAFAAENLPTEHERELFVLLMTSDIPLHAPNAPHDLVRLTGKPKSTLANLKTEYSRMLKATLAEKIHDRNEA